MTDLEQAAQQALEQPEQKPVAWAVQGCSKMWRGEFAEIDAKAEAKRIGGTCVAYALYTTPPAAQPEQERVTNKSELRRLNEEVTKLKSDLREEVLISNEILEVKDQLLAALQNLENDDRSIPDHAWAIVQAAIAKAEGTNP
jgi:hypothetical protein